MATAKGSTRLPVGSGPWISEERSCVVDFAQNEADEFIFSARNEVEWLNEHMAEIFSKDQVHVAEIFKTPGKLRGKTPRTARKVDALETRVPLSDVFSSTPKGVASPFRQALTARAAPAFEVAEDRLEASEEPSKRHHALPNPLDSGYFGSQATATQATQPMEVAEKTLLFDAEAHHILEDRVEPQIHQDSPPGVITWPDISVQPSISTKPDENDAKGSMNSGITSSVVQEESSADRARVGDVAVMSQKPTNDMHSPTGSVSHKENIEEQSSPSSDDSSPVRPIMRKSSLNFASLPAREPLTTKKSIGARTSTTSHFGKHAEKSFDDESDCGDEPDDLDGPSTLIADKSNTKDVRIHNKTSTQRLQDQISKLGAARPATKPASNPAALPSAPTNPQVKHVSVVENDAPRKDHALVAPGAFPVDEDDSWIGPAPITKSTTPDVLSPRPPLLKGFSAEVMEGIHGKDSIGGAELNISKRGDDSKPLSSAIHSPERPGISLHAKSVSTSMLPPAPKAIDESSKYIAVSNPDPSLDAAARPGSPRKTPSKTYKTSPLKAAKDKFSSILKTSKGLFASSAAVSAEAKSTALATAASSASTEDLYPKLDTALDERPVSQGSPAKSIRRTRSSAERAEKRQQADDRAAKEEQRNNEQLEKARLKVDEEARVFRLEQERVAAMQKEISEKSHAKETRPAVIEPPRATRSSPRKTKAQLEAEASAAASKRAVDTNKDVEMQDVSVAPSTIVRPRSQIGRPVAKRPIKPSRDMPVQNRPPTVIRVDTGSQRGQQYHPSTATLASTLQDSLAPISSAAATSAGGPRHKASTSSISSKASTNSYKSAANKALEAAARKKEQDDLAVQRKKEVKAENDRQRAMAREEERRQQEQQRQKEAIRQREAQKEKEQATQAADAKKAAARQAVEKRKLELDRAKQTGAPPPAPRGGVSEKAHPLASIRDQSKLNRAPLDKAPADGLMRPIPSTTQNQVKMPLKRPLPMEEDAQRLAGAQRNPPASQSNESQAKRRKTSEEFEVDMAPEEHPRMTAPPIRQSIIRPKESMAKTHFPAGYTNAPAASSLQRTTLLSQHHLHQMKPAHPMDMAQVSKAPIAFGSSSQAAQSHKTPARPGPVHGAKSAIKSSQKASPRYQNGESIDLPEIHTDSEDEDSDGKDEFVALGWTNSPDLRKALALQETIDPAQVFGQPGPINMEEVFSKSKDRFKKFRDRTSSANWSGLDKLTEDEVKRDLEARDRVRRQGGWTYDSMV